MFNHVFSYQIIQRAQTDSNIALCSLMLKINEIVVNRGGNRLHLIEQHYNHRQESQGSSRSLHTLHALTSIQWQAQAAGDQSCCGDGMAGDSRRRDPTEREDNPSNVFLSKMECDLRKNGSRPRVTRCNSICITYLGVQLWTMPSWYWSYTWRPSLIVELTWRLFSIFFHHALACKFIQGGSQF